MNREEVGEEENSELHAIVQITYQYKCNCNK